ncbi:hypothetical protein CSKR_109266 [Clonorchis sinensis]|uniref:Uncharacterized protein n=1 Tax=Clonorchis sinensis TaxID=79923 RepID=A0A3R7D827_CLOSI|nr:hypothetical protein CSKR_109266 [Clonorchis sinensis]
MSLQFGRLDDANFAASPDLMFWFLIFHSLHFSCHVLVMSRSLLFCPPSLCFCPPPSNPNDLTSLDVLFDKRASLLVPV